MDLAALRTAVFAELNEDEASPKFWTLADVDAALNSAYSEISDLTDWYETSGTVTIVPATSRYVSLYTIGGSPAVPTSDQVLAITKVYDPATRRWLTPTSPQLLDPADPNWELARGAPFNFIPRGAFSFGVYPLPNDDYPLTVYTTQVPHGTSYEDPALESAGDTPGFPSDFHQALVWFAVYELLCQDAEYKKAMSYYLDFQTQADKLRKWTSNRASYPMTRVMGGGGLWP